MQNGTSYVNIWSCEQSKYISLSMPLDQLFAIDVIHSNGVRTGMVICDPGST